MKRRISILLAAVMALTLLAGSVLVVNAADYDVKFIKRIPIKEKWTREIEEAGTIETLEYTTHAYSAEEETGEEILITKVLQVYLPYGYDPANQYNIIYLTHGAGESEYYWLNDEPVYEGTKAMGKTTKAVLNNMIAEEVCDPVIAVSITSNITLPDGETVSFIDNKDFYKEIRNDIVPFVESQYSTYAGGDVSEENLIATRDHRAFAGFSMGGAVTADHAMMKNLDLFSYFGTYSAAFGPEVFPYTPEDFQAALTAFGPEYDVKYWFNGDGTSDFVHDDHLAFNEKVLELMPDWFEDGVNYAWIDFKGGSHAYNCWIVDLYNSLLVFFK